MTEWKKVKLKEVSDFTTGKLNSNAAVAGGEYPFFTCSPETLQIDTYAFDQEALLLAGNNAEGNFSLKYYYGRFNAYQRTYVISSKDNNVLGLKFLYYSLRLCLKLFKDLSQGTATKFLTASILNNFEIVLPPVDIQKSVTRILASIDDKIELNAQINHNLEEQAKAIFKSWFVDFEPFADDVFTNEDPVEHPASLSMVQIANIDHILETGKRPKGGAVKSGIPSIGAENVKKLGVFDYSSGKFIPREFADSMKRGKINGYELLIYKDGGKPGTFIPHFSMFGEGYPYEECYINEHVFKLDFGNKGFNAFAYFYFQTDYPYSWLANNGGKAAIPGINQEDIRSIFIFDPQHPKVKEFSAYVSPIFTTIMKNCLENKKLAQLRDALLPKLMSGEIDMSEVEV